MNKTEQLYEGKAKKVFATDDPNCVIVSYKEVKFKFRGRERYYMVAGRQLDEETNDGTDNYVNKKGEFVFGTSFASIVVVAVLGIVISGIAWFGATLVEFLIAAGISAAALIFTVVKVILYKVRNKKQDEY